MLIRELVINSQAKQLPCVIKGPGKLVEILEKSMQEITENPEKYFINKRTGNLREQFTDVIKTSGLRKYGVSVGGIDSIEFSFNFKPEKINGEVVYTYSLESFYPVEGSAVWEYNMKLKTWVKKG